MNKDKSNQNQLKGYEIYIDVCEKQNKSYNAILETKKLLKETYENIDDINTVYHLIEQANHKSFLKNDVSLGLVLGWIGYALTYLIENIFSSLLQTQNYSFKIVLILLVVMLIITLVLSIIIICIMKKLTKSYRNSYRIFILPYEIELLEKRRVELEKEYL